MSKHLYHNRSANDVRYFCEERLAFDCIAESFFGFVPPPDFLARLIGADEHSEICLGTLNGRLYAEHFESNRFGLFGNCRISRSRCGNLQIFQESNMYRKDVPRKKLKTIFQLQIEACCEVNIEQIIMLGRKNQLQQSYYLLPLFGFDGPLPNAVGPIFPAFRRFGELFKTNEGREWWKHNGFSIPIPLRYIV